MLDLSPIFHDWVYPVVALVLSGFVIWLMAKSGAWLNAHAQFLDAVSRERIAALENEALNMGVQIVEQQLKAVGDHAKVHINSPVLRFAAQVAVNHASGVLADNGADPDEVAARILAKLPPEVVTTDTTGITIKTTPVETKPLGDLK